MPVNIDLNKLTNNDLSFMPGVSPEKATQYKQILDSKPVNERVDLIGKLLGTSLSNADVQDAMKGYTNTLYNKGKISSTDTNTFSTNSSPTSSGPSKDIFKSGGNAFTSALATTGNDILDGLKSTGEGILNSASGLMQSVGDLQKNKVVKTILNPIGGLSDIAKELVGGGKTEDPTKQTANIYDTFKQASTQNDPTQFKTFSKLLEENSNKPKTTSLKEDAASAISNGINLYLTGKYPGATVSTDQILGLLGKTEPGKATGDMFKGGFGIAAEEVGKLAGGDKKFGSDLLNIGLGALGESKFKIFKKDIAGVNASGKETLIPQDRTLIQTGIDAAKSIPSRLPIVGNIIGDTIDNAKIKFLNVKSDNSIIKSIQDSMRNDVKTGMFKNENIVEGLGIVLIGGKQNIPVGKIGEVVPQDYKNVVGMLGKEKIDKLNDVQDFVDTARIEAGKYASQSKELLNKNATDLQLNGTDLKNVEALASSIENNLKLNLKEIPSPEFGSISNEINSILTEAKTGKISNVKLDRLSEIQNKYGVKYMDKMGTAKLSDAEILNAASSHGAVRQIVKDSMANVPEFQKGYDLYASTKRFTDLVEPNIKIDTQQAITGKGIKQTRIQYNKVNTTLQNILETIPLFKRLTGKDFDVLMKESLKSLDKAEAQRGALNEKITNQLVRKVVDRTAPKLLQLPAPSGKPLSPKIVNLTPDVISPKLIKNEIQVGNRPTQSTNPKDIITNLIKTNQIKGIDLKELSKVKVSDIDLSGLDAKPNWQYKPQELDLIDILKKPKIIGRVKPKKPSIQFTQPKK